MKRTALLKNVPSVPKPDDLQTSDTKVYGISQVAEYEGKQYLNVDLYYLGELRGRYFADGETYAANVQGKWYNGLIENAARLCMGKKPYKGAEYYTSCFGWDSDEDNDIARDYLGRRIESYEYMVNQDKYGRAYRRKVERIEELMAKVPALPDKFDQWVHENVFPKEYLFTEKKNGRIYYGCTACGATSWKKAGWKNYEKTTCPKCGYAVEVRSRKKEEKQTVPVVVMQIMGNSWIERQLVAECKWRSGQKHIEVFEEIRAIVLRGRTWGKVYYGQEYDADETEQDFWTSNRINRRWKESLLYPGNLKEIYEYNGWKRNGMEVLAANGIQFNVNRYVTQMRDVNWVEYLIKAGLINLTKELIQDYYWGTPRCINGNGRSVKEFLQLDGNRTNRFKQLDGNLNTLEWLQYEQECEAAGVKKRITQETLDYLTKKRLSPNSCKDILEMSGSPNRMANYLRKQKEKNVLHTWRDYIRMAEAEGLDVTDDIVRFPKDLRGRHDELVRIRQERADIARMRREKSMHRKLDRKIKEYLSAAARFYWKNNEYVFIPAGKCKELVNESKELHHCVGTSTRYMENMANGISWIVFLRKKEDVEKAYYTLEIDMRTDEIIQFYSSFDRQPDKAEIQKVLRTYRLVVKRRHKKTA